MSEKAPQVLGGTRPNVDNRFHLQDVDENEENKTPAPSIYALQAEDDVPEVTTMESLCMNCHEDGTTKLLLTMIPYFREVILMSFECEHCGFKNSEVQFGGTVQEQGAKVELEVTDKEDLNRQLIKADAGVVYFPELDFEIPRETQRGSINTIEGVLQKAIEDLRENQEHRREIDPETTEKIDEFIAKLALMSAGISLPFKIVLDDPSGNSHIENPHAPAADPKLKVTNYYRSEQQDLHCGLQPDMRHDAPAQTPRVLPHRNEGLDKFVEEANIAKKEVIQIPADCFACQAPGFSCMCMTDIPHFKEVIIMSFNCEACGFKTNEVKAGGAIPPQGERITLKVDPSKDRDVMDRDILKSDSACVNIPEIELEMAHGSLGGLYTTLEGLLDKIRQNIEEGNPFAIGDSDGGRSLLNAWLARLDALKRGTEPFTLILEDPLANSFVYSPFGSADDDPYMVAEKFTRSEYEDDVLGITDMKVENYSSDAGLGSITEEEDKSAEPIRSDKETMGGGRAIDPSKYHPNPTAVMEVRQQQEEQKKLDQQQ
ncbi:Zinc finger protein [Phytophthora fragariae]|uniref:Zinc finger protein n=1 Tax=Phytophthora fragariae TaxID=53985 RepID=A0A6A4EUP8_9STRA|nr:Zinc finger protein [Phytophthora fragariae]KAE8947732.1 Zinc finger protein [Phytophthora fragariae]KAE9027922.1 Zinc finger protein [Phytophthora fragariae]KAE9135341.1 Zinc finger protein [Phytophthora fragariae]KAE9135475.1 Zinc finger protein [Phytophthora fragariae]